MGGVGLARPDPGRFGKRGAPGCGPDRLDYDPLAVNALVRRVVALLSLVSALASVVLAGQSYFFCPWMQRAGEHCCCAPERSTADGPAISRAPCCARKTLAVTPSAPTDLMRQGMDVPPASAFSRELIRMLDRPAADLPNVLTAREHGARAGPPVEPYRLNSVYLI